MRHTVCELIPSSVVVFDPSNNKLTWAIGSDASSGNTLWNSSSHVMRFPLNFAGGGTTPSKLPQIFAALRRSATSQSMIANSPHGRWKVWWPPFHLINVALANPATFKYARILSSIGFKPSNEWLLMHRTRSAIPVYYLFNQFYDKKYIYSKTLRFLYSLN